MASTKQIVPIPDVMAALNCGRTKVYALIEDGQLVRVRLGSKAYVTRESLDALIANLPVG